MLIVVALAVLSLCSDLPNRAEFQSDVKSNAGPLTKAVIALLKQMRKDSTKITTHIQSQP